MNFLKKAIGVGFILAIAFIDLKIIVNYEIVRPTEKYSVVLQKKTVAQVLDLSSNHPEEVYNETVIEETPEVIVSEEKKDHVQEMSVVATPVEAQPEKTEEIVSEPIETVLPEEAVATPDTPSDPEVVEPEIQETTSATASSLVETALQYVGYSYVSGGASPETGFDCSGFTQYIFGLYNIHLNRVSGDQAANGTPVSKEDLQPGDLVLFSYYGSESIGHSGIYIGNGNFVHAANSRRGVVIDTLESGYYLENYITARRLF